MRTLYSNEQSRPAVAASLTPCGIGHLILRALDYVLIHERPHLKGTKRADIRRACIDFMATTLNGDGDRRLAVRPRRGRHA